MAEPPDELPQRPVLGSKSWIPPGLYDVDAAEQREFAIATRDILDRVEALMQTAPAQNNLRRQIELTKASVHLLEAINR